MAELDRELQLSADVPVIAGCALIVPAGLLAAIRGRELRDADNTQAVAARAREIVMEVERKLGYLPRDCESERLGYDIESRIRGSASPRSTSPTITSSPSSNSWTMVSTTCTTCASPSVASRTSAPQASTIILQSCWPERASRHESRNWWPPPAGVYATLSYN